MTYQVVLVADNVMIGHRICTNAPSGASWNGRSVLVYVLLDYQPRGCKLAQCPGSYSHSLSSETLEQTPISKRPMSWQDV